MKKHELVATAKVDAIPLGVNKEVRKFIFVRKFFSQAKVLLCFSLNLYSTKYLLMLTFLFPSDTGKHSANKNKQTLHTTSKQ